LHQLPANALNNLETLNLSTHVEPLTPPSPEPKNSRKPLSLRALVAALEAQRTPPSLEQLNEWLENAEISREDLEPFVGFKEGNYWRHRVCRNEFVEMLVLCWRPGHRTPIHDHNGSHGAVMVYDGVMWETTFVFDKNKGLCYRAGRQYGCNEVTAADIPDIHQLGNPDVSERDLITIHIYAPPLGVLKTYKAGSTDIDLYTPDDSQA
jgi:cysteine dioxygenase